MNRKSPLTMPTRIYCTHHLLNVNFIESANDISQDSIIISSQKISSKNTPLMAHNILDKYINISRELYKFFKWFN